MSGEALKYGKFAFGILDFKGKLYTGSVYQYFQV